MKILYKNIWIIFLVIFLWESCNKKSEEPVPSLPVATLTASVVPSEDYRWIVTITTDKLFFNDLDVYISWTDNATKLQYSETFLNVTKYVIAETPNSFRYSFPGNGHVSLSSKAIDIKITGIKYYSNDFTFKY
jgi:hypothetical protein